MFKQILKLMVKYIGKVNLYLKIFLNSLNFKNKLIYIIEGAGWSTDEDGYNIIKGINSLPNTRYLQAKTDWLALGYKNKILHFGTWHLFFKKDKKGNYIIKKFLENDNKIILTIFHIEPKDEYRLQILKNNLENIKWIHTSSMASKNKLIDFGIPADKIVVIPLGVDLNKFKSINQPEKIKIRKKLNLPRNKIIIGSFQKDGNGWGEGLTPKLIKGPDIFCQVVQKLSEKYSIHVLLTGPARGYVKQNLERAGISYTHKFLKNYDQIIPYWQVLDLYLITSRLEGGPKAILEAWASGVPLVSTKVGMIPDIAQDGKNILLAENENTEELAQQAEQIINNESLAYKLIVNGKHEVEKYSWEKIALAYYQKLYV